MAERRIAAGKPLAVAGLGSGDTLLLERGGVWTSPLGISTAGLRVGAYGDGAKPLIRNTSGTALSVAAKGVTVEDIAITGAVTNRSTARAVEAWNATDSVLRRLTVADTKGGDNIYGYRSDRILIEDCDLSSPGPNAGDQIHLTECVEPVVRRTHMHGVVSSGKGHLIFHQWNRGTKGGLIEDCLIEGAANYGIGIDQGGVIARRNTIRGVNGYSAFWFDNDEFPNGTILDPIEIYENIVEDCSAFIGSWVANTLPNFTLNIRRNEVRRCSKVGYWEGKGGLAGVLERNVFIASGSISLPTKGGFRIGDNWQGSSPPDPEPEPPPGAAALRLTGEVDVEIDGVRKRLRFL